VLKEAVEAVVSGWFCEAKMNFTISELFKI
jgi:hypothetical protein